MTSARKPERDKSANRWLAVAQESELDKNGRALVLCRGRHITLFKIEGEVYAVDNQCPHARGPLEDGLIQTVETPSGETHPSIACPWHHAEFDLVTGRVQPGCETDEDATVFPAKLEGGLVWVRGVTPRNPQDKL